MVVCNSHGGRSPQARHAAAKRLAELSARREAGKRLAELALQQERERLRYERETQRIIESIGR